MTGDIAIVGAGLSGNLLAIMLAQQKLRVSVHERGAAPDSAGDTAGRSINLALAARGIQALERAGIFDRIEPLLLPMDGRIIHEPDAAPRFSAYGQYRNERIYSVSRAALNRRLFELARERWHVDYRFDSECLDFDADEIRARFSGPSGDRPHAAVVAAADGAGSLIRQRLFEAGRIDASEQLLDHGYKELTIAADETGGFALDARGLHIWPRGGFMLIALPNLDRTFTATLFLPHRGRPGFDRLDSDTVDDFFIEHFPDVVPLIPNLAVQFGARPVGILGTVQCAPWSSADASGGRHVVLVGDAAHAIVPFHGQGMNAAFEDCAELAQLVADNGPNWGTVLPRFEAARRDNCRAIAEMALENYEEMRDTVRDPRFGRRAALAFELERRFEGRFIPRYSMVMFHPEIGYAEAQRRGRIQNEILDRATAAGPGADETDLRLAEELVERLL